MVEISGVPVRLSGELSLRPFGDGTVYEVQGDLKASVPLIGGRIEKAAESAIRAAIRVEERTGRDWLDGRSRLNGSRHPLLSLRRDRVGRAGAEPPAAAVGRLNRSLSVRNGAQPRRPLS